MATRIVVYGVLAIGMLAFAATTPRGATVSAPLERFTATAVDVGGIVYENLRPVELVVTRWSTDAEERALVVALLDKGPEGFIDRLCDIPSVGSIYTMDGTEYVLRFARQVATADGGRHILFASDRPIFLWNSPFRPRLVFDPPTFLELRLKGNGEGEGKVSSETKIEVDEGLSVVGIFDYADRPVRLMAVRSHVP